MTTTTQEPRMTEPAKPAVAPWVAKIPADARPAFLEGRRIAEEARELTDEELALRAQEGAARERVVARAELMSDRACRRWSMWCHQVPMRFRDPAADCDHFIRQPFEHWLGRLDARQQPDRIAAWLKSDSSTLLITGPTGTGKTHAALTAGYAAAGQAVHTRFLSQLDYLAQLRPGGSDDPGRVRWNALNTSLLIFDDLGAETEGGTEFVRREVCGLLDGRLNEERRQIITLNGDPNVLADTFGDRIMDRLRSNAAVIKLEGESRRSPARQPW